MERKYITLLVGALLCAGCSNSEEEGGSYLENDLTVHFAAGVETAVTRATTPTPLAEGKVVRISRDGSNYYDYTSTDNQGNLAPSSPTGFITWAASKEQEIQIYAASPAFTGLEGDAFFFTLPTSQTDGTDEADFATYVGGVSRPEGASLGDADFNNVSFTLQRRMSQVNFSITECADAFKDDRFVLTVHSPASGVSVDYTGTVTPEGNSVEVQPYCAELTLNEEGISGTTTAIVTPGDADASALFLSVAVYDASGKNLITTMDIAGCPALAAGSSYTFTLSILDDRIFIGDVSVTPWVTADDVLKGSQDAKLEINNPFTLNLDNYSDKTDAELQEMLADIFTDYEDVTDLIVTGAIDNRSISTILNSVPMTTLDMTKVTGLTEIPESTFSGNTTLQSISLSSNVTTISSQAFSGCTSLRSINASQVNTIGASAFYDCTSLVSLEFSELTSIASRAFYNCSSLQMINASQVNTIGESAFSHCSALKTIDFPELRGIPEEAFYQCSSLLSINAPKVTEIGLLAFHSCHALQAVNFPQVTSELMGHTFAYCYNLRSVRLDRVSAIGQCVFQDCNSLETLYLPSAMIFELPFGDNSNYIEEDHSTCNLTLNEELRESISNVSYTDYGMADFTGDVFTYNFRSIALANNNNNITSFTTDLNKWSDRELYTTLNEAFWMNQEGGALYLFGTVIDEEYHNLDEILTPTLPITLLDFSELKGISKIPSNFIEYNRYIRQVELSEDFTTIGSNAFENSTLEVLNAPGVTTVENSAFENCENLRTLYLPKATKLNDPFGTTEASYPECTLTLNSSLQNYVEDDMYYIGETGMYRIQFLSIQF